MSYSTDASYSASLSTNPYLSNPGALGQAYYHSSYILGQQQPPPPPPAPPSPVPAAVSPLAASKATQRFISAELKDAGFHSAEPAALERLEREVVFLIERLYGRAHEYANLANRAGAITTDLVLACNDFDMPTAKLRPKRRRRNVLMPRCTSHPLTLVAPPSRSPSPELLSSDDEESQTNTTPFTLRNLPETFPALPPKHTYHQTPISPPKKAALPSLEKKLKTAGLVQESLRNLMLTTEDNSGQEDAELLGHTVNWESNVHPRKRWKVGI
ncbi:hypothetical protein BDZ89DRAFT_942356 [Hymenopellis radicata]|nr:hypothetical protein BDZ89DRAFT_942356 [Hymenopellis radicata]